MTMKIGKFWILTTDQLKKRDKITSAIARRQWPKQDQKLLDTAIQTNAELMVEIQRLKNKIAYGR